MEPYQQTQYAQPQQYQAPPQQYSYPTTQYAQQQPPHTYVTPQYEQQISNAQVHPQYTITQPNHYTTITTTTVAPSHVVIANSNGDDQNTLNQLKIMLIVGFFFNIVWIVAFVMSRGKGPQSKKLGNISAGLFAVHFIIGIVVTVAVIVIYLSVFFTAVGAGRSK
jgi:hypothetical protein